MAEKTVAGVVDGKLGYSTKLIKGMIKERFFIYILGAIFAATNQTVRYTIHQHPDNANADANLGEPVGVEASLKVRNYKNPLLIIGIFAEDR